MKYLRFDALLLQQGWLKPAYVGVDALGIIGYLSDVAPAEPVSLEYVRGFALPGFPNGHSHAFQFAMAGMAEKHSPGSTDDFWTWREAMYECALSLDPQQVESVAAMAYSEMLRRGYTHVAEFHYLHHDQRGNHYNNRAEMGERLLAAADTAGIKLTLIPIFYQKSGFGSEPEPRQRRFICETVDEYLKLFSATQDIVQGYAFAQCGFGVHSLRAVSAADVFRTVELGPRDLPFHLHAAEQLKEVEDCKAFLKQRPVEWLIEHLPLKERFNIVHCTHLDDDEVRALAQSRANVILCPGTEGNLGDGIFRLHDFSNHYGNWAIGTDSHVSLNPMEDLRWLDYGQRVTSHKRNTFDDGATVLLNKSVLCGRKALGLPDGNFFEVGKHFDAMIYDAESPFLRKGQLENLLPAIVYTSDPSQIKGTIVNGSWIVKDHVARNQEQITVAFEKTLNELGH
jgi:formimidoylglutamate deiminase